MSGQSDTPPAHPGVHMHANMKPCLASASRGGIVMPSVSINSRSKYAALPIRLSVIWSIFLTNAWRRSPAKYQVRVVQTSPGVTVTSPWFRIGLACVNSSSLVTITTISPHVGFPADTCCNTPYRQKFGGIAGSAPIAWQASSAIAGLYSSAIALMASMSRIAQTNGLGQWPWFSG